jgi:protein TonB
VQKSLDIVLVQNPSTHAPDKADYLAPKHQIGGGKAKEKAVPKAAPPVPYEGAADEPLPPTLEPQPMPPTKAGLKPKLTQRQADKKIQADEGEDRPIAEERPPLTPQSLSQQIVEVSAEINKSQDAQAQASRVVEINAVSAHRYKAAAYEAAWQQKIERIGTLNYPDDARRKRLAGRLTLSVGIRPDGSIDSIKLLQPSSEPMLDDAAQRIVRLAAPFAPFPEELKQQADVLVITRAFCFAIDNRMETCR